MNSLDDMMIPLFITDKGGVIIYKNRAAKRCIPSPRLMGNINNYLNTKMSNYIIRKNDLQVRFIKNEASAFNRALVFPDGEERDVWCFIPELIIFEPENISEVINRISSTFINSLFKDMSDEENNSDKSLFVRYQRIYTELLSVIRQINTESHTMHFSISDIFGSLKKKTDRLASLYGLRMTFDVDTNPMWKKIHMYFEPFAAVYVRLLSLMLRMTDTSGCAVSAFSYKTTLTLTATSALTVSPDKIPPIISTDILPDLCPTHASDIHMLIETVKIYGFGIDAAIKDGRLSLSIRVPLGTETKTMLCQNPPTVVVINHFQRMEKRIYEYMESMFLQI